MIPPRVIEVELPGGRVLLAEVRPLDGSTVSDVGALARFKLDDAAMAVGDLAQWLMDAVTARLPRKPDKVGIDFGIKLALKTGKLTSVLAEASGEASATVRLEWTNPDPTS